MSKFTNLLIRYKTIHYQINFLNSKIYGDSEIKPSAYDLYSIMIKAYLNVKTGE